MDGLKVGESLKTSRAGIGQSGNWTLSRLAYGRPKPHLSTVSGVWRCQSREDGLWALGQSPVEAYVVWGNAVYFADRVGDRQA